MTRNRIVPALALMALLSLGCGISRADETDLSGTYQCRGVGNAGGNYSGTVEIAKKGDTYTLKWALMSGEQYAGTGILDGSVLSVSAEGNIVVAYHVEKAGKLVGKWALPDGSGKVYSETLTK